MLIALLSVLNIVIYPLSKGWFERTAGMRGILTVDTMYEASRSRRECRVSNGDGKLVINTIPVSYLFYTSPYLRIIRPGLRQLSPPRGAGWEPGILLGVSAELRRVTLSVRLRLGLGPSWLGWN